MIPKWLVNRITILLYADVIINRTSNLVIAICLIIGLLFRQFTNCWAVSVRLLTQPPTNITLYSVLINLKYINIKLGPMS